MVKPLTFKGDKKPKKRKRAAAAAAEHSDRDRDPDDARSSKLARRDDHDHDNDHGDGDGDGGEDNDDSSWVSADATGDVLGPVMMVLPTEPPTALACDVSGKVFVLGVENMVDGNPASAEPHDVRMVWVANRIAGTGGFRFKGHHGRYLACDKAGLLSATSEAISPLETWSVVASVDARGAFQLQTQRDTFLTIRIKESGKAGAVDVRGDAVDVRGDAESAGFDTTVRIRMQARYKPHVKAAREKGARAKISRRELEEAAGRRLNEEEVKVLKRAKREGDYHERLLEIKVKSKHDKFG